MALRIQLRRDTAANWTLADPILAEGEAGFETDTGFLKIGDGATAWSSLAYFAGAAPPAWDGDINDIDLAGGTDIGAALADGDLILVDDGAAGTNRKSAISRMYDYILAKFGTTPLPVLNGGTGATSAASARTNLAVAAATLVGSPIEIQLAASDETTALTTGDGKAVLRAPCAFLLTAVRASVTTAPTGANLVVQIRNAGNDVLSTTLTIDATEKTSTTAATPAVINGTYDDFADDAEIQIDLDQVGSTVAGAGLKITLIGTRA